MKEPLAGAKLELAARLRLLLSVWVGRFPENHGLNAGPGSAPGASGDIRSTPHPALLLPGDRMCPGVLAVVPDPGTEGCSMGLRLNWDRAAAAAAAAAEGIKGLQEGMLAEPTGVDVWACRQQESKGCSSRGLFRSTCRIADALPDCRYKGFIHTGTGYGLGVAWHWLSPSSR